MAVWNGNDADSVGLEVWAKLCFVPEDILSVQRSLWMKNKAKIHF